MSFNSFEFALFFPAVVLLYFALPHRFRVIFLLVASYYFYMSWNAAYLLLLGATTLFAYVAGLQLGSTREPGKRKAWLLCSIVVNLGVLSFFKYFNFFSDSARVLLNSLHLTYNPPLLSLLLPIGISFYTFQTLSYTFDVYRNRQEPEKHLGRFALYVAFFPQLVAGPIERSSHLLPQFRRENRFDPHRVVDGLLLMGWGFFKKLVIADRLGLYVNTIYNEPTRYTGVPLIVATYFFAWQLYCDFSGYSDIAVGAAKVMGYDLMENFRRPFYATSIADLWSRWHISLTTWFRDYVYIPLARRRRFRWHPALDFVLLFTLIGLWHGASWNFVLFGIIHGLLMALSIWTMPLRRIVSGRLLINRWPPRLVTTLQMAGTFHLFAATIILFRANTLSDARYIFQHLMVGLRFEAPYRYALGLYEFVLAVGAILFLEGVHGMQERGVHMRPLIYLQRPWLRWSLYYALIFAILIFGEFGVQEFIYFQF